MNAALLEGNICEDSNVWDVMLYWLVNV